MTNQPMPLSFQFDRRSVYVVGANRSGQDIARHCLRRGDRVFISDRDVEQALDSRTTQEPGRLFFSRGRHDYAFVAAADLIVLSPGVPFDCEIVRFAMAKGKCVQTTVEFVAAERTGGLTIVTGTSGKTTTLDVLRRLVAASEAASSTFLTDRAAGIGISGALESPSTGPVVAELSVSELADVRRLAPNLLVVTSLAADNSHDEFADFEAYLDAKLGWLAGLESTLPVLIGSSECAALESHFARRSHRPPPIAFELVPDGIGPVLTLAERVRRVMTEIGLGASAEPRPILDAIRATLLDRCETIEGFAMPILNIGECKNAESLAWTADAICPAPRIITARSLDGVAVASSADVIDLNQNPVALEEAIEIWTTGESSSEPGTVVIDEVTRRKLFAGPAR